MKQISCYEEAIEYLKQKQSLGIKPGLSRIRETLEVLLNPQDSYKVIHVAGTNGKGTVAATIAKALQDNGYKVGLFSSPWVVDYREQIKINGEFISEEKFWKAVRALQMIDTDCTEFELLCVLAYFYFKIEKVEYAVIECGMGGKDDATNVEKKNLSVITSISLDHTDFLGASIEEIAENKSGILRKNCDCVIYSDEYADVFRDKCNNLIISPQSDNLSIVNTALDNLGLKPLNSLVKLPARQERKNGILLDGGHNVAAAKMLEPIINDETAVIGMMRDKDIEGYLSIIAPKCKRIIAVNVDNSRAISAVELASRAKSFCDDVITAKNAKEALKYKPSLICGSFYMIREIYNLI